MIQLDIADIALHLLMVRFVQVDMVRMRTVLIVLVDIRVHSPDTGMIH
jgi:hypothetical protein